MSPHVRETRPFASETKFVVSTAVGEQIRGWARENLEPDPYGGGAFNDRYHTASLYFDTIAGDVFYRRRSFGRSKYRVRRYGEAEFVFLERKLRKPGVLVKRRTTVSLDAIHLLAAPAADPDWPGEWFHRRLLLRQIRPVCQVSYARVARFARTAQGPARLTLDENVRVLPARHARFSSVDGETVLPGQMILELKYLYHLPAIFKRLVETFTLEPQRASKYRLGMTAIGEATFASPVSIAGGRAHL